MYDQWTQLEDGSYEPQAMLGSEPVDAQQQLTWIDGLVASCTSFGTWEEFAECMLGGYTPTIHQHTRRRRLLTRIMVAWGWAVFDGQRMLGEV